MNDDLYERAAKNWDAVNAEIFRNLVCYVYNIPYDVLFGGTNMKIKYSRMVDEYVKKKYGNLDRGVLSDEVKYKVLFKIYRKKYKKEKALRKAIEKMHRYAPHPAEELKLCDTCKYQNKDGEFCEQDLVQNKESDCYEYVHRPDPEARPDCVHCKHSKMSTLSDYMGATTAVLYCEKKKYKCDLLDPQMCEYFEEKER